MTVPRDEPGPATGPDSRSATRPDTRPASDGLDDTGPLRTVSTVTTTVRLPRPPGGRHAAPEDAAERGSLTIADSVPEKVALAAAMEIEHVGGAARRVLGVPTAREDGDGRPRVSAKVSGEVVAVEMRLSVAYPASVRRTTEAVRAHVRDRVHALTALTVSRVDITVAALSTLSNPSTKRVVQ